MKIKINVTNDITDAQGMVCALKTDPLMFKDNIVGRCSKCNREVQHRPTAPPGLMLLCAICWLETVKEGDTIVATPKTVREVQSYFNRN